MDTQHIETLVVGAGQAGLATAYHLTRRGRPVVVVDANARIGDNWRQQWDTLRLYFCGLSFQYAFSSMVFPGVSRDADYLARQIVARSATAHRAAA